MLSYAGACIAYASFSQASAKIDRLLVKERNIDKALEVVLVCLATILSSLFALLFIRSFDSRTPRIFLVVSMCYNYFNTNIDMMF
jgi:hypothetical protein